MKFDYILRETAINLRRNITLTLAAIVTVAVSLALFGSTLLLRQGVENQSARWQDGVQVLVFLQRTITDEQRTALEKSIDAKLFRRVGRGVVPTTVADSLRPHAERTLAAAAEAQKAIESVTAMESGTIRFGMFGTARLYAGASLVADVLRRHPGVRVELIGQNSSDVQDQLRRGYIEAAMIAIPQVRSEGMTVTPVATDERRVGHEVGAGHRAKPTVDRLDLGARLGVDAPEDRLAEVGQVRIRKPADEALGADDPHR